MTARPGPRNLITDVPGIRVGCAENARIATGVTVIRPDERAVCAADVRGGGPGTRETDALAPHTLVDAVDALVLSGGSVYGLAAADGVAAALGARGEGFAAYRTKPGVPPSPIVPGGDPCMTSRMGAIKTGETAPPYAATWRRARLESLASRRRARTLGSAGAGYGARAGSLAWAAWARRPAP